MLVGILMNEPHHLKEPSFAKVRVPLTEFEALDKEDRMRLLVEEINRSSPLGQKNGIGAFESLLEEVPAIRGR